MVAGRDTGRVELPAGGSGAASAFPARCCLGAQLAISVVPSIYSSARTKLD